MNTRNDPDSPENAAMTRDNERAVFAAKMQAKQAMTIPSPEAVAAAKTHPKYDDAYPVWKRELEEMAQRAIDTATADLRAERDEALARITELVDAFNAQQIRTQKVDEEAGKTDDENGTLRAQLAEAREALSELMDAMYRYQSDVDDPPTAEHRAMIHRAECALSNTKGGDDQCSRTSHSPELSNAAQRSDPSASGNQNESVTLPTSEQLHATPLFTTKGGDEPCATIRLHDSLSESKPSSEATSEPTSTQSSQPNPVASNAAPESNPPAAAIHPVPLETIDALASVSERSHATPRTDALVTELTPLADTITVENAVQVIRVILTRILAHGETLETELAQVTRERDEARQGLLDEIKSKNVAVNKWVKRLEAAEAERDDLRADKDRLVSECSEALALVEHKFERAGGIWKVAMRGVELGVESWASNVENGLANLRTAIDSARKEQA